ncbi:MAG TPA: hypothetical protein VK675_03325 [Candidatus Paceibacterota bacterium]|nr:hypothetical protein [Candidatus Paceibacterota bacterium]
MKAKKKNHFKAIIGILALLGSIILVAVFTQKDSLHSRKSFGERDMDSVRNFWKQEVLPIQNNLSSNKYHIKPLQERMNYLANEIERRHGKKLHVKAEGTYNPVGKKVMAQCRLDGDVPVARISIQSLMDTYSEIENRHRRWHEEFELAFVIILLHELEHMAREQADETFESLITEERATWASTCEYVIEPVLKEQRPVWSGLMVFYIEWMKAGQTNNEVWGSFMRNKYSVFKK